MLTKRGFDDVSHHFDNEVFAALVELPPEVDCTESQSLVVVAEQPHRPTLIFCRISHRHTGYISEWVTTQTSSFP